MTGSLQFDQKLRKPFSGFVLWKTRRDISVAACRISKDILPCILLAVLITFSPFIGGLCVIETKLQFSDLPRSIMSGKYSLCLTESTLRVESHAN